MQLSVGQVFHLKCRTCRPPKMKFFVVALLDPLRFFLINSNPSPLQARRAEHMAALARIRCDAERFLEHDSWVACTDLFAEYDETELQESIRASRCFRGELSVKSRAAVHAALVGNRLLPRKYLGALLEQWPGSP